MFIYIFIATYYEMRVSSEQDVLEQDFLNAQLLNVSGVNMAPNVSGKVERLVMVVSSDKALTTTTYFAIVAIDEAENRGPVSNIIPITIGLESQIQGILSRYIYYFLEDVGNSILIYNDQQTHAYI